MKRTRVLPGQFRVRTLFLTTVVISVALAAPRLAGWTYTWFFGFLWIAAFGLAPSIAFVVTAFVPWLRRRDRILLAVACLVLAIVPILAREVWLGGADEIPAALFATSLLLWLPQVVCIWGVWHFLFRKERRR